MKPGYYWVRYPRSHQWTIGWYANTANDMEYFRIVGIPALVPLTKESIGPYLGLEPTIIETEQELAT